VDFVEPSQRSKATITPRVRPDRFCCEAAIHDSDTAAHITRTALTLGGAHGIFKTSRLEQLFRHGALGSLHPPPSDFCLYNIGLYELGIDPTDVLPPMKPA
jgi:alkylation response protein AidB-like acyl-CoA dehydrogenase